MKKYMKNFLKNKIKNNLKNNRGFALFYAIIMISVISAIAFGLASITYKQKILASLATDSQTAFYAADAGMECALYNNQAIFNQNASFDCFDISPDKFGQFMTLYKGLGNTIWSISARKETCFSAELVIPVPPANPRPSFSVKGYNTCQPNNARYIERNLRAFF